MRVGARIGQPTLRLLAVTLVAAGIPMTSSVAAASGGGFVEVRLADGRLAMQARQAPLRYPQSGAVVRIRNAKFIGGNVELRDVSILRGRIRAQRLVIPRMGFANAAVEGLVVDGRSIAAAPNQVLPLGTLGYVIVLQQAVLPGEDSDARGLVGLRIYLAEAVAGLRPGTQLLIGLPGATVGPREDRPQQATTAGATPPSKVAASWRTLGFTASPPVPVASAPAAPWAAPTTAFPLPAAVPALNGIGAQAAALAQIYLGVPYVWAGADPSGFDCSGLTMFIYRQLGVSLTHFTGNQWDEGRRIPSNELQLGDLVFFEPRSYGPGHEGIYIGGGQFIHAPHTGDVVKISNLADYARSLTYMGAVRPY